MKNDKLRRLWQKKKKEYSELIEALEIANSEKEQMLDKLESEMKEMNGKVEYFYEAYTGKDKECNDLK
jgi:hypothetical protein